MNDGPIVVPDVTAPIVAARMWNFIPARNEKPLESSIPAYTKRVPPEPARLVSTNLAVPWDVEMVATHEGYQSGGQVFSTTVPAGVLASGMMIRLRSSGSTTVLPAGSTVRGVWPESTTTTKDTTKETKHEVPEPNCSCGIYAVSDLDKLMDYGTSSRVFGVVHLWGRVVPGEHGWRAEKARIVGLVAHNRRDKRTRDAARAYSVPVLYRWPALTQLEEVVSGHR